jgi:GNAT superfamily N-acetyltransferase
MEYQITLANPNETEELLFVQKSAYRSEAQLYNDYNITPLNQTVDELREEFKDHIILKAVLNGKIAGTVRACEINGTCYIGRPAVLPDMQNLGIGSALLKETESRLHSERYELFNQLKKR